MRLSHARQNLTLWIAIFAMLVMALAPAVSRFIAAERLDSGQWVEICTRLGLQWVRVDAEEPEYSSEDPSSSTANLQAEFCPYCTPHAGFADQPPPTYADALYFSVAASATQPLYDYIPRSSAVFLIAASPRAPPPPSA